jgi:hypothetical protein
MVAFVDVSFVMPTLVALVAVVALAAEPSIDVIPVRTNAAEPRLIATEVVPMNIVWLVAALFPRSVVRFVTAD